MTLRTAAASLAVAMVVLFVLPTPVSTASLVNLSRYVVRRQVAPFTVATDQVSGTRIQELCADEDGCAVTLRMENANQLNASRLHLFYGTVAPFKWMTSVPNSGTDGDLGFATPVANVNLGALLCMLSDGDGGGVDSGAGFELYTEEDLGAGTVTCEVVISD